MPLPAAQTAYNMDVSPVVARGLSYSDAQLDEMLQGPVKDILNDTAGTQEMEELLAGVATTDFEKDGLKELLNNDITPENWRVGEAIAESYVTEERDCYFPWPTSRDLKNPDASPAGADLTGFQKVGDTEDDYRFAFGEVKTSEQQDSPPNVVYGRSGLQQQMENLCSCGDTKKALVRYLAHHATNATWKQIFQNAAGRYLRSQNDIAVFGILIRDIDPNQNDLSARAQNLSQLTSAGPTVELYALYFTSGTIAGLSQRAVAAMTGGGAL